MKKLLFIITLLFAGMFYTSISVAQAYYKTPSNIAYYKIGSGPDVIIYMDGYYRNVTPTPLNTSFYKSFLPSIQSKVTCYIPIPIMNSGWEKPWNGTFLGTEFLDFVSDQHPTQRIFVATYSAGGDPGYVYGAKRITAFASVAGSDTNWKGIQFWVTKKVPVWAVWGSGDTSENNTANCRYTWLQCFQAFGGTLTYKEIPGNHGVIDDYAYNPANGLWEWFDSIGKQPVPPPLIDDQGKSWYYSESEKVIIFETVNGKKLRVTPD